MIAYVFQPPAVAGEATRLHAPATAKSIQRARCGADWRGTSGPTHNGQAPAFASVLESARVNGAVVCAECFREELAP